jgi:hypothetical protein
MAHARRNIKEVNKRKKYKGSWRKEMRQHTENEKQEKEILLQEGEEVINSEKLKQMHPIHILSLCY